MVKKYEPLPEKPEEIHVYVEKWQWKSLPSRFTWKHGLALFLLLVVAVLFAFGFLIVAAVVLMIGVVLNVIFYFLNKLA